MQQYVPLLALPGGDASLHRRTSISRPEMIGLLRVFGLKVVTCAPINLEEAPEV
jgi:hypothetical protein